MPDPFLLSRILLQFDSESDDLLNELSAAAITPDGSLWVGSDEYLAIERLSLLEPGVYGEHKPFFLKDLIELFNDDDEIDIEGMDYAESYLWFTGSHSRKRKKPKGKKAHKDIERLTEIKTELNRCTIARIPVLNGELLQSYSCAETADESLTAATLKKTPDGNVLLDALKSDEHLGPIISSLLPSKDNGFDIEGLAVHGSRLFLGLRGPVLRGWAIILEIEVALADPNTLVLNPVGEDGRLYKKHFLNLNGLGIRELCLEGDDLIILAGPTMALEGAMEVFRWHDALDRDDDSLSDQESGELEILFDLPFTIGYDHAEGLALTSCLGESPALLIVYDSPNPIRRTAANAIMMDIFRLP
jgi:hypothetical protein